MTKLDDLLLQLHNSLGADYIASLVIGADGLPLAFNSFHPGAKDTMFATRHKMIQNLAQQVCKKMNLGVMEEELVTTDMATLIIRSIGDGSACFSLVIWRNAMIGPARLYMNEFAPQIWDAIPRE